MSRTYTPIEELPPKLLNDVMFDRDFNQKWGTWKMVKPFGKLGIKKDSELRRMCTVEQAIRLWEAQT